MDLVRDLCTQNSVEAIAKIEWPRIMGDDKLLWLGSSSGKFSVKSAYLTEHQASFNSDLEGLWKSLWKAKIHERHKLFIWRALAGALPTRNALQTRVGIGDKSCVLCGYEEETIEHLFRDCSFTRAMAYGSKWSLRLDALRGGSWMEWMSGIFDPKIDSRLCLGKEEMTLLMVTLFYTVWKVRNDAIFTGKLNLLDAVGLVERQWEEYKTRVLRIEEIQVRLRREVSWSPPEQGCMKVNVDAATKDGKNSLALVVRDWKGGAVLIASSCMKDLSAELAELRALVWASDLIEGKFGSKVAWCCDAHNIVNLVNSGDDPCNWHSRNDVLLLRRRFRANGWQLQWTARESNKVADRVAKLALDNNLSFLFDLSNLEDLPPLLFDLLASDAAGAFPLV